YPLIFWSFHGLITDGRPRYLIAAPLSLAGLLLSHNISAMLFAPLLAAYLVFLLWLNAEQFDKQFFQAIGRTFAGGLLGLGLAAIFWLPAFGESDAIKLEGITQGFFDFRENFIKLSELLSLPLPLDLSAINPEFPLSLGLPQLIAGVAGFLGLILIIVTTIRSYNLNLQSSNRLISQSPIAHSLFFLAFLLLFIFMSLPISQYVWETVPLVELAEFPWRMLGPAIFCASFLAGTAFYGLSQLFFDTQASTSKQAALLSRQTIALLIAIFLPITLNAYYLYPSQFIVWGTPTPADAFAYEVISGAIGTTSTGEFLPRDAQQHPQPETLQADYEAGRLPQKIDPATVPAGAEVEMLSHLAESNSWQIKTPTDFVATIRTLYWPGWQLYLNDQPWPFDVMEEAEGLITSRIPAGEHILTLQLESTPLRTTGQWLTIISTIILALIALLSLRNSNQATLDSSENRLPRSPISTSSFTLVAVILFITPFATRPFAPLFTLQSSPDQPQPADQHVQADFGDQIRLVGIDTLPETVHLESSGAELTPILYWRALQSLETNYSMFVHLDAPNGQTFATVDEVSPENIPTRNWPPTLYLRNPLHLEIPADIPPIRYNLTVGVYNQETLERLSLQPSGAETFTIGQLWVVPSTPQPVDTILAHFGPDITLRQASLEKDTLNLVWHTETLLPQNYTIFVHLLDSDGQIINQQDGVAYDGLYPTSNWMPGQYIADQRLIGDLVEADEALQTIALGLYLPETGERLIATDAAGQPLLNNSYLFAARP
ncbi:MAG: hypothetical protein AAF485_09320, partial [Chloroflexota bacterium]